MESNGRENFGAEDHGDPASASSFQDTVMAILMGTEELKQTVRRPEQIGEVVDATMVLDWRNTLEDLMHMLYIELSSGGGDGDDVQRDMRAHCHQRVADVAQCAFDFAVTKPEAGVGDEDDTEKIAKSELETECQASIARLAELNIILQNDLSSQKQSPSTVGSDDDANDPIEEIIDTYVGYQRQVLRQRSKPAISRLVAIRKHEAELAASGRERHVGGENEEDGAEEDDDQSQKSSHIHVITVILGQSSALIHPLIAWRANLSEEQTHLRQLCTRSIGMLDDQAQKLTKTVAGWFADDRNIDDWMSKSTDANAGNDNSGDGGAAIDLAELDALVEEMAFACQVFARYVALVNDHTASTTEGKEDGDSKPIAREIQPVWTWNYATLERYLGTQQWKSALRCANPVHIVIGTAVKVPSVVEDAQYLSTRALERAASTRSTQAIGIVAQSVANDVWSTDINIGVYHALVNQTGCWQDPESSGGTAGDSKNTSNGEAVVTKAPSSFAAAFLGALDNDSPKKPPSAPSSGAFLSNLPSFGGGGDKLEQIRIETSTCALNGWHSASASCSSLVQFLDSLLPNEEIQRDGQSARMIQLAREELFRFADVYQRLLQTQTRDLVNEWCGLPSDQVTAVKSSTRCLPAVRYFFACESYELKDASALQAAEEDMRLEQNLLQPLLTSKLLQRLSLCDVHVLMIVCDVLAESLVTLVLDCMIGSEKDGIPPKRVNDWGALLFSKQARVLQNFVCQKLEAGLDGDAMPVISHWERLSQAATALQLETPSDWVLYHSTSVLTPDELQRILSLRVEFSKDAIASVVATSRSAVK